MATYELRVLKFGEILDGAFAVYRRHFGVLVGVAAACTGIPTVINVYMSMVGMESVHPGTLLLWVFLYGVGGLIAAGATIRVVSEAYLGLDPELGESIRFALGKMGKIFFSGLAKYLMIGLPWLGAAIVMGILGAVVQDFVLVTLVGAAVVVGTMIAMLVLVAGYSVVTQAVVLEDDTSATEGLGRSWELTKGFRTKAFFLGVVLWVLLSLPIIASSGLTILSPGLEAPIAGFAGLLQLIIYPVYACAFTLLYYDLRVRKEAFDIEYLGRQLGIGTVPA
jgi:hypothetical protein